MEYFVDVLVWVLAVFGASNGFAVSALLKPIREFFNPSTIHETEEGWWELKGGEWVSTNRRPVPFFGKLIVCPMCLGFWFGILLGQVWFSPAHNFLADGFFGSITSWMLYLLIQNKQFGK